jgi:hypothetical protein
MRVKLQLVMCSDDGHEETVIDLVTLQKDSTRLEHLGLSLKEAKQLLKTTSFRPLSALLTESAAPALLCMETKWASLAAQTTFN